jgi:hypothetical protein
MEATIAHQEAAPAPPWTALQLASLAVLVICGLALGWYSRVPDVLTGNDDLTLLLMSRSLGEGRYLNEFLVGQTAHVHYPPGVPAWLLIIRWTLGEGLTQVQGAQLALLALTAMLVGDGLRRLGHAWLGVAATGAVVLNPHLQYYAGTMLSESLYTFWGVATVWVLLRAAGSKWQGWVGLAIVSALAGFLTRTVGLALVAGVGAWLLWRGRWRMLAIHTTLALVVIGGWFGYVRVMSAGTTSRSYAQDLASVPLNVEVPTAFQRILSALVYYLRSSVPDLLGLPMVPGSTVDNIAWTVLIGACALTGLVILIRRWEAVPAVFTATMAVLLVWPWPIDRLAVPLIPLAIPAILLGASSLGGRGAGSRGRAWAGTIMGLTLILCGIWRDTKAVARLAECPQGALYATESPCTTAEQRSLVAGAVLTRQYLPAGAAVVTLSTPVVYHFGGHLTVHAGQLPDPPVSDVRPWLDTVGAHYLLVTAFGKRVARSLLPACESLTVVARAEPMVLLLAPYPSDGGQESACEPLRQFLRETELLSRPPGPR